MVFDESKVISALHSEKAEIGRKYWASDSLIILRAEVETSSYNIYTLAKIVHELGGCPFQTSNMTHYQFLYPYEEPQKQRMTNRQLAEWLAKGNGQWKDLTGCYTDTEYTEELDNDEIEDDIYIRHWVSEEWIEPTLEVYLRDCKGIRP